ncbi:MAG: hypothetical protein HWN81_05735 [Candidatus Lokiarchaeota archaeon]|nr:hypothetical protein [Candidatus Lokiarchaeota archaeon]
MSDKEIAYDVRLEERLEEIKLQIWLNEELQIMPEQYHLLIVKNLSR